MKASELRQKSKEELEALLAEKRQRVLELSVLGRQGKMKNVHERFGVRKDVARVMTILTAMSSAPHH